MRLRRPCFAGWGWGESVKVPALLEVEPEVDRGFQIPGEAERRARRHAPAPVHDLVDPLVGHLDGVGESALGDAERPEELLEEHLPGMGRRAMDWSSNHADFVGLLCS